MLKLKTLSRKLRNNMTDAERKLWSRIRKKQVLGVKFRRQVPIDNFIADFVCFEKRLVIELDGGQHDDNQEYDANRTEILKSKGFIVLRFWNNDVMENMDGVLDEMINTINPHPNPPPLWGGEL